MKTLAERFDEKVVPVPWSGCWLWTGATTGGYGSFKMPNGASGTTAYAHRIAWERANGPVPAGKCVLHSCDVPACVNVDHLFLGTKGDNSRDMVRKGRQRMPSPKPGASNPAAKLTATGVAEIRAAVSGGEPMLRVARRVGVSPTLVRLIVTRQAWKEN